MGGTVKEKMINKLIKDSRAYRYARSQIWGIKVDLGGGATMKIRFNKN